MVIFPLNNKKAPAVPKDTDWRDYRGEVTTPLIGAMIPNGVIVLDVDTYKGVTVADVELVLGCSLDWDNAELQRTVSGGLHYVFSVPFDVDLINGSNVFGLDGFDTRSSCKGYIATGDGYANLTFLDSAIEALHQRDLWPALPDEALARLMSVDVVDDDDEGLLSVLAEQPLDITEDEARMYLARLDDGCADDRAVWLKVTMAIGHQFGDTKLGYELFDEFCKRCPEKYDKRKNLSVWKSIFKSKRANPVTFASVIELAGGRDVIAQDKFESLFEEASNVFDLDGYNALKDKVRAVPGYELGDDMRSMIAAELFTAFGKEHGITKSDIKKALSAEKKPKKQDGEAVVPFWLDGWVYVEMTCEFANTSLNYAIKREAFNAKYDRESECIFAEKSAATLALVDYRIPTVVDKMFWPGADIIFEHEGKRMLNTYHLSGIAPCNEMDDDGQSVIDLLIAHVEFTLEDPRERDILLDWIAFVVQNPGQRINWALLLQGAQGVGKSYFVTVMQHIMGELVRNLDPTAINGRFTGWAHGALVVAVEEIRINGTNRYETLDRMKPFISNATVQIEEKGRDHRTVPNFSSYFLLTNHKDAIPLTSGDRRYCVLFSRVQSEAQLFAELGGEKGAEAYFDKLFSESERRADALAWFFMNRKISASFSAKGRAPETNARKMMMQISTSPERDAVEEAIERFNCDVINDEILDVTWLNELAEIEDFALPKSRTLSAILLEMGYEQIEGRRVKIAKTGKYHYVWLRAQSDVSHRALSEKIKEVTRNFFDGDVPF